MDGVTVMAKIAHIRLRQGRSFFVRAYPCDTQETTFDADDWAFAFFKGTCTRRYSD